MKRGNRLFSRIYFGVTRMRLQLFGVVVGRGVKVSWSAILRGNIRIGDYSYIGHHSNLRGNLEIGPFFLCADNVVLIGGEHQHNIIGTPTIFSDSSQKISLETRIGVDVWIGRNVSIRRGVNIGNCAVIGAGSVVLKDVAAGSIVAGVPAVQVAERFNTTDLQRHLDDLSTRFNI